MSNKSSKILIVDDVDENIKLAAKILKGNKYNISYARSGKEALKKITLINFDLILMDVMMPEMDGYETTQKIKKNNLYKDVPIIFITAKNDVEDIVKGFNVGGVDYITKPFNSQELLARVNTHINLYRTEKELRNTIVVKDKMMSIISHDLLGPLGMIKMASDMFVKGEFSYAKENVEEFVVNIQKSIDTTYDMMSNVLEWAINTNNLESVKLELFKPEIEVQNIIKIFEPSLSKKKIGVNIHISNDMEINYDKDIFNIIIRNLISNAIKFTKNAGIIDVYTEYDKKNILYFCVKDNGVGISQEIINKLQDRNSFYTSNGVNNEKGHGLGLKIIKDFIGVMNGKLFIESEIGKYSIFKFSIENNI